MIDKYLMVGTLAFLMLALPVSAVADAQTIIDNPGMLPDSPFYVIKQVTERIHSTFTFNEVNRAELEYKHALTRLGEAQQMADIGEIDLAETAMNRYRFGLEQAQSMVQFQIQKQYNSGGSTTALEQLQTQMQNQEQIRNRADDDTTGSIMTKQEMTQEELGVFGTSIETGGR